MWDSDFDSNAPRNVKRKDISFDFEGFLVRQRTLSERVFGPLDRKHGVVDHIRKELLEIEQNPQDLEEWIDVVLLALDGAWRTNHSPEEIIAMLEKKLTTNENRKWPDYRTVPEGKAIEHRRDSVIPHLKGERFHCTNVTCSRGTVFHYGLPHNGNKVLVCNACGAEYECDWQETP